ncbi:MAG TPA: aspartate aminotransferase family protein [Candidatus Acidoferrales bacterium]|jgi:ornithine--oxo-acid transaminase|nr:aspartate aminotransferase family protein [Candidatus Acidoferrales bacterium]
MSTRPATIAPSTTYSDFVNPQWVALLDLLGMNVEYKRCMGTELFTSDARRILDFLSGYCVHNTGHNHPHIVQALKDELDRCGPAMLQSHVPELAGELAQKLCTLAGGGLKKAYFCSSGSEGVEAAIKFARANTGRTGLVCAKSSFHGLTAGALSLMSDPFWRDGFGPLLQDTSMVPFGDLPALEKVLSTEKAACFIVEPVQAEAGIVVPDASYLKEAQALCRRFGTLLVLDEVQTGMYRTGTFLAAAQFGATPDIVILAKALSGGLVPVGAVLMTDEVYRSVYSSLKRSIVHTSTFSENGLSMRAGLATLEVLEREKLGTRATDMGKELRESLRQALALYEMVKEIRGLGMLSGIEFTAPRKTALLVAFKAFHHVHPAMFGQMIVMRMFRKHNILTQICGNNFMVLKVAPPLVATKEQLDEFVASIREVVEIMHSSSAFWTEALGMARRAINI